MNLTPSIIWACLGIVLIVIEIFTTTFVLLFFGIAGLIVAGITLFGYHSTPVELIIFGVVGCLGLIFFRKKVLKSFAPRDSVNTDQNKQITLSENIPAGKAGHVVYRGSPWMAFNNSTQDMVQGETVVIEKIEGVRLVLNRLS